MTTFVQFVDTRVAQDYQCGICLDIIHNAVQIGCNDHFFCEECVNGHAQTYRARHRLSFPCPICRCPSKEQSIVRVKGIDRQIKGLQVKCTNHCGNSCARAEINSNSNEDKSNHEKPKVRRSERLARKRQRQDDDDEKSNDDDSSSYNARKKRKLNTPEGCNWIGCLSDLDAHIDACPYQIIRCEWCSTELMRRHHDSHIVVCPLFEVPCDQCQTYFVRSDMDEHLAEECPMRTMTCPQSCGDVIASQDLKTHIRDDCNETLIDCKFKNVGCLERIKRKDEQQHCKERMEAHLNQTSDMYECERAKRETLEQKLSAYQDCVTRKTQYRDQEICTIAKSSMQILRPCIFNINVNNTTPITNEN